MNYHRGVSSPRKISPLERQLNLVIALLNTPGYLTADEIRHTVAGYSGSREASRQMFERDKQTLKALGVPLSVQATDGTGQVTGYRIDSADYHLDPISFTSSERTVLNMAMQLYHSEDYDSTQRAFDKLGYGAGSTELGLLHGTRSASAEELTNLATLTEAAAHNSTVTFNYHTATEMENQERHLEPWGVVADNGHWYCLGYDCDRHNLRVFRLSRIAGAVVDTQQQASAERPSIGARELLRQQLSHVRRYVTAQVRIDDSASEELRLAASSTSPCLDDPASTLLHFDSVSYQWLRDTILAEGPHAKVEEPADLAAEIMDCLQVVSQRGSEHS